MSRLDKLINEAKDVTEARIVPWEDIYMPLLSMKAFSTDDLAKVKQQLFAGPNSYNDKTPTGTSDFLRVVERIFGRMSKQFVQAHHLFRSKGWECFSEAEVYKVGDRIKFDSNIIGVNPKIGYGVIQSIGRSMATQGSPAENVYRVKLDNGNIFNVDQNMVLGKA